MSLCRGRISASIRPLYKSGMKFRARHWIKLIEFNWIESPPQDWIYSISFQSRYISGNSFFSFNLKPRKRCRVCSNRSLPSFHSFWPSNSHEKKKKKSGLRRNELRYQFISPATRFWIDCNHHWREIDQIIQK